MDRFVNISTESNPNITIAAELQRANIKIRDINTQKEPNFCNYNFVDDIFKDRILLSSKPQIQGQIKETLSRDEEERKITVIDVSFSRKEDYYSCEGLISKHIVDQIKEVSKNGEFMIEFGDSNGYFVPIKGCVYTLKALNYLSSCIRWEIH